METAILGSKGAVGNNPWSIRTWEIVEQLQLRTSIETNPSVELVRPVNDKKPSYTYDQKREKRWMSAFEHMN
jgi:hypothetical protein